MHEEPQMELSSLFLRFSALVLCFISAITLANHPAKRAGSPSSFTTVLAEAVVSDYPYVRPDTARLRASSHLSIQLFKGVYDIYHGALSLYSKEISDYLSFILDQVLAYLLISSSSLGLHAIPRRDNAQVLRRAAIVVVCSFLSHGCLHATVWLQAL